MKARSPVRVEQRELLFGLKATRFVCDARLQAAEFEHRKQPERKVIVHRSTKQPGKWQTSRFDERGASSDVQSASCTEALRELSPKDWRLRNVSPKR